MTNIFIYRYIFSYLFPKLISMYIYKGRLSVFSFDQLEAYIDVLHPTTFLSSVSLKHVPTVSYINYTKTARIINTNYSPRTVFARQPLRLPPPPLSRLRRHLRHRPFFCGFHMPTYTHTHPHTPPQLFWCYHVMTYTSYMYYYCSLCVWNFTILL